MCTDQIPIRVEFGYLRKWIVCFGYLFIYFWHGCFYIHIYVYSHCVKTKAATVAEVAKETQKYCKKLYKTGDLNRKREKIVRKLFKKARITYTWIVLSLINLCRHTNIHDWCAFDRWWENGLINILFNFKYICDCVWLCV